MGVKFMGQKSLLCNGPIIRGLYTFFGYVILNTDHQNAEWGYFSLNELKEAHSGPLVVIIDCSWEVKRFGVVQIGEG